MFDAVKCVPGARRPRRDSMNDSLHIYGREAAAATHAMCRRRSHCGGDAPPAHASLNPQPSTLNLRLRRDMLKHNLRP